MRLKSLILLRRAGGLLLCALLVLNVITLAEGQSGRRVPKPPTSPDPLPPPQSEPPIQPPKEQSSQSDKNRIPVLVVKYLPNISSSSMAGNIVIDGFLERMQRAATVKVRAGKDMNRKEASDYAKSSEDNYVVWLQLQSERGSGMGGYEDPNDLYVDYVVFAPGTGKSKTSGHVYQRTRGAIQMPRTTSGAEYTLRRAGVETAERVLSSLGQAGPPIIHN